MAFNTAKFISFQVLTEHVGAALEGLSEAVNKRFLWASNNSLLCKTESVSLATMPPRRESRNAAPFRPNYR